MSLISSRMFLCSSRRSAILSRSSSSLSRSAIRASLRRRYSSVLVLIFVDKVHSLVLSEASETFFAMNILGFAMNIKELGIHRGLHALRVLHSRLPQGCSRSLCRFLVGEPNYSPLNWNSLDCTGPRIRGGNVGTKSFKVVCLKRSSAVLDCIDFVLTGEGLSTLLLAFVIEMKHSFCAICTPALTRYNFPFIQLQCFVPTLMTADMDAVSISLSTAKFAWFSSHGFP